MQRYGATVFGFRRAQPVSQAERLTRCVVDLATGSASGFAAAATGLSAFLIGFTLEVGASAFTARALGAGVCFADALAFGAGRDFAVVFGLVVAVSLAVGFALDLGACFAAPLRAIPVSC